MKSNRYSLYKLNNETVSLFDSSQYSLLKFGHKKAISHFADKLFHLIVDLHKSKSIDLNKCVILIGPYQFIDTASSLLTKQTVERLNDFADHLGLVKKIESLKVDRKTTYFTDYAKMSKEDRYNLIKNDSFYVDYNKLGDNDIIIIDDIRISGTHEDIMFDLFQSDGFSKTVNFLFLAEIDPDSFEPAIEHHLNSTVIETAHDLIPYLVEDSLEFTTRGVKMIFSLPEVEFLTFLDQIPISKYAELYHLAIGNEYDKVEITASNIAILNNKIYPKN